MWNWRYSITWGNHHPVYGRTYILLSFGFEGEDLRSVQIVKHCINIWVGLRPLYHMRFKAILWTCIHFRCDTYITLGTARFFVGCQNHYLRSLLLSDNTEIFQNYASPWQPVIFQTVTVPVRERVEENRGFLLIQDKLWMHQHYQSLLCQEVPRNIVIFESRQYTTIMENHFCG